MPWKSVILALLTAGPVFGQSGLFNVAYRPQPRIIIPTVEPSPVIVSNDTVVVNPHKDLRFTDFYLAAVDQTGTLGNPILFEFSSVSTNEQSGAVVFYQRAGDEWPSNLLRRVGSTITVTNEVLTVTSETFGVFTNWNSVVSSANFPSWIYNNSDNEYCYHISGASKSVRIGSSSYTTLYAPLFEAGSTNSSYYAYGATSVGGSTYRYISYVQIGNAYMLSVDTSGAFFRSDIVAPEETNFWYQTDVTNISYEVISANILSVAVASSNEASAIEVFPIRQGQKWMKQTNPDVKWMCLLSNGVEWYSTPAGDPVWFNCAVDWVDRIPEVFQ
jgi:hypothetical protein